MTILRSLKKFCIDDLIARTKRIYFWCFNVFWKAFPCLYIPYYYLWILRPIRIGKDGRVGVLHLESMLVDGCNLRCEFCNTFSPYLKGYTPAEELLESFAQWSKKVKPQYFILIGGEPLLHPELARIIRESAKIWKDSRLWLTTNGLLLDRVKPDVLQAMKDTGIELTVSEHTLEPEHRKTLDAVYVRLKEAGIRFVIRPSRSHWIAMYQYGESGNLLPYKSNPKQAWNNCLFRGCTTILGNKLFRCAALVHVHNAVQKGGLDAEDWKTALTYQPLTLQSTPEEIVKHLRRREIPECSACFENVSFVPVQQVPLKKNDTQTC